MPFDPDKYLAEKAGSFNPDQYLAEKSGAPSASNMHFAPDVPPKSGTIDPTKEVTGENAWLGLSQTFPVGKILAPVGAMGEKAVAMGRNALDPLLGPNEAAHATADRSIPELTDETRGMISQAEKSPEYKIAQTIGQVGSMVAAPAAAVPMGVAMGGLEGYNQGGLPGAAGGAALGYAAGKAPELIGKGFSMLSKTQPIMAMKSLGTGLKNWAAETSYKLLKLPTGSRDNMGIKGLEKLGQTLADGKYTTGFKTLKVVYSKVAESVKAAGSTIGAVVKEADDVIKPMPTKIFVQEAIDSAAKEGGDALLAAPMKKATETVLEVFGNPSETAALAPSAIHSKIKALETLAGTWKNEFAPAELQASGQALSDMAHRMRQMFTHVITNEAPKLGKKLIPANEVYSGLIGAKHQLEKLVTKSGSAAPSVWEGTKRVLLTTPVKTAAIGAASSSGKALEKVSQSGMLKAIDKMWQPIIAGGGKLGQTLQNATTRGVTSVAATHHILLQTDPDYRDKWNKQNGDMNE